MAPLSPETAMDLILWRHAEAEVGSDDLARRLTVRGAKQANQMAAWLKPRLPKHTRIRVSPALRTQQTADAQELPYETIRKLAPDASVYDLLSAAGWPDSRQTILIVGHQPTLGQLAALLLSGQEAPWTIKKGAVWWFSNRTRQSEFQTLLRAAISPELG